MVRNALHQVHAVRVRHHNFSQQVSAPSLASYSVCIIHNAFLASQELQDRHSEESAGIRAYHKGVTTSNLDTIQQLRKELADMTRKEAAASSSLAQVTAENRSLHEPLAQVRLRSSLLQSYTKWFNLHSAQVVPTNGYTSQTFARHKDMSRHHWDMTGHPQMPCCRGGGTSWVHLGCKPISQGVSGPNDSLMGAHAEARVRSKKESFL